MTPLLRAAGEDNREIDAGSSHDLLVGNAGPSAARRSGVSQSLNVPPEQRPGESQESRFEPLPREDGRCAFCNGERTIPSSTYATREQYEGDPFCSKPCCEKWYGTYEPPNYNPTKRGRKKYA